MAKIDFGPKADDLYIATWLVFGFTFLRPDRGHNVWAAR